jgi:hypothetical protein
MDTYAVFKGCKLPKNKQANFVSSSGSSYFYGKDKRGSYVIRVSNHWSKDEPKNRYPIKNIASCYWPLKDNSGKGAHEERAGKAYFKDFSPVKWR